MDHFINNKIPSIKLACLPLGNFFRYNERTYIKGVSASGKESFRCTVVSNGISNGNINEISPDLEVTPLKQENRLELSVDYEDY